ncbi:MAG: PAS domain-containing protein [Polyangiaceae bacterium]
MAMRPSQQSVEDFLVRTRRDGDHIALRAQLIVDGQRGREAQPTGPDGNDLAAVVAELRARNEELALCVEELRAQRDALAEGRAFIERERAKFHDLFENAPDAFVTSDAHGVIVDANRATGELFGTGASALPGKLLISFVARSETRAFRNRLRSLERPLHDLSSFETLLRPRGGTPFSATMHVRPVRTGNGQVVAHRWTIRNASRWPSAASREVHELLSVAVDELQAPLATLNGWSTLLRRDELDAVEARSALEQNASSARTANAVLDELAELVALARDGQEPTSAPVTEIVSRSLHLVREHAAQRGVCLDLAQPVPEVAVRVRPTHVTWALRRLLGLAIAATTADGAVTANVSLDPRDAIVNVRATGAAALGGSALAVAVAGAAIERQAGKLYVPELAEQGIVFEVRLPLDRAAKRAAVQNG